MFPLAQARSVAACLETNGVPVELKVLPGAGHGLGGNRLLVFRLIGEQCLVRLKGPGALAHYRSILAWQAQAWPLWLYWMPALGWAILWLLRRRRASRWRAAAQTGQGATCASRELAHCSPEPSPEKRTPLPSPTAVELSDFSHAMVPSPSPPQEERVGERRPIAPGSPNSTAVLPSPLPSGRGEGESPRVCLEGGAQSGEAGGVPAPLRWWEIGLRWVAGALATAAVAVTALHVVPPRLAVSQRTLSIARKHLVEAKELSEFDYLAAKPIWRGKPLKTLLEHVELAHYNRELINWKLDERVYREFVLSPEIDPEADGGLNWRRPLWENFYPRIRREQDPEAAAEIVVRFLRERVTVAATVQVVGRASRLPAGRLAPEPTDAGRTPDMAGETPAPLPEQLPVAEGQRLPASVTEIWQRQITNERGFEAVYVAALRSVGVPARLGAQGRAEFWTGSSWQAAPRPLVEVWL